MEVNSVKPLRWLATFNHGESNQFLTGDTLQVRLGVEIGSAPSMPNAQKNEWVNVGEHNHNRVSCLSNFRSCWGCSRKGSTEPYVLHAAHQEKTDLFAVVFF